MFIYAGVISGCDGPSGLRVGPVLSEADLIVCPPRLIDFARRFCKPARLIKNDRFG